MIAAAALALVAALGGGASATSPRVGLIVSPGHVSLAAGARAEVRVGTNAAPRLVLRASVAGLGLDAEGKPRIVALGDAGSWLTVRPKTFAVGRAGARIVVVSHRRAHARPGDHSAIVLLTATTPGRAGVTIAMRVGLVVTVRVAGRARRRVDVVSARATRTRIFVTLANRGDLIEPLGGAHLQVLLLRRGKVLARLSGVRRFLLPRSRAIVGFRYRRRLRGLVILRVAVTRADGALRARRFPLRL